MHEFDASRGEKRESASLPGPVRPELDGKSLPSHPNATHPALISADHCARELVTAFIEWQPDVLNELRGTLDAVFLETHRTSQEQALVLHGSARALQALAENYGTERQLTGLCAAIRQIAEFVEQPDSETDAGLHELADSAIRALDRSGELAASNSALLQPVIRSELFQLAATLIRSDKQSESAARQTLQSLGLDELGWMTDHYAKTEVDFEGCALVDGVVAVAEECRNPVFAAPLEELFYVVHDGAELEYLDEADEDEFRESLDLAWEDSDVSADEYDYSQDLAELDEDEFDEDVIGSDDDVPLEAYAEMAAEAVLEALVHCQNASDQSALWKNVLRNLDESDVAWTTALAGISLVEPEFVRPLVHNLLVAAADWELGLVSLDGDSPAVTQQFNAIVELVAANESMFTIVRQEREQLSERRQKALARVCEQATEAGDIDFADPALLNKEVSDFGARFVEIFALDRT